jgi:hypothetical protein
VISHCIPSFASSRIAPKEFQGNWQSSLQVGGDLLRHRSLGRICSELVCFSKKCESHYSLPFDLAIDSPSCRHNHLSPRNIALDTGTFIPPLHQSYSMTVSPSNLVTITSAEHFTELMSSDLNRVSLLNFWASWAEPCEQMNAVVQELAEKFPQVLCLMVSIKR